jgi:2-isopropylmalate synthase
VDAAYRAIDSIVNLANVKLLEYKVHAVTEGVDAQGEVSVRVAYKKSAEELRARNFGGYSADPDVIVASAKAYLFALNSILAWETQNAGETATVGLSVHS